MKTLSSATIMQSRDLRTNDEHRIAQLPILVLFPHNRCNCRCVMCDIWKIRQIREITEKDLAPHIASLRALQVKWVVFSGGEPLMHSDLPSLCRLFKKEGVRLTLLTAGMLLEQHAAGIAEWMDDVIVSIDGPPDIHDRIRAVPGAYRKLERGIRALRELRPRMGIQGRCTIQKQNFRELRKTIQTAHDLRLDSVSFLAADLASSAFNRAGGWPSERQADVALTAVDVRTLDLEVEALIEDCHKDMESGFVVETPEKLRRIALHFRAHLGETPAIAPRCNAPWVSSVIEADGTVRPCFFHDAIGNIHDQPLLDLLNDSAALEFRRHLDVATNPTCRNCVCALSLERGTSA